MTDKPDYITSSAEQWEKLKPLARDMRHQPTPAEDVLWQRLRHRQVKQAKFRRQHSIDGFIVDFVCIPQRLIVEIDGSIHDSPDRQRYDAERQARLEALGFRVIRFTNGKVLQSTDSVVAVIADALTETA
jgi:very-short-patch-repair endonuclease